MKIRGKNAYLRKVYQLFAYIGKEHDGIDDKLFTHAVWIVYEWARKKADGSFLLPDRPITVSKSNSATGNAVAMIYEPEEHFFTLRFSVTELAGLEDGVIRRNTEVEIRPYFRKLIFAARSTAYLSSDVRFKAPREVPEFLRPLMKEVGLNDGVPIQGRPWTIRPDGISEFVSFLRAPERRLPVVAVSQAKNPGVGSNGYLFDLWRAAKSLAGIAHVAEVPWDVTFDLSSAIGSDWSCFNGAVRVYWPGGIDFESDDPYRHPLYTWKQIEQGIVGSSFEDHLARIIGEGNIAQSIDWAAYGIRFYIEAEQSRMAAASPEEPLEDRVQRYQDQLARMHESLEEYSALADEYYADMLACKEDCEAMHKQMAALTALISRQRGEIARVKNGETEKAPVDLDYRDMPGWVEQYYPDRLYLHPRAVRALKDATYQNPSMVYRCLILLAEEYHSYRMGNLSREEFLRRCSAVDPGLIESGSGESSGLGEQGDEYFVTYGGRRCLLERHLKKGVSHNPMYCMRIYFFWDAKNSLVVIGSLPGHLRTSET